MSAEAIKVIALLMVANAVGVIVMAVMSLLVSFVALEGLAKLDRWMRRKVEKRLAKLHDENV